jgi:hypothetical protein
MHAPERGKKTSQSRLVVSAIISGLLWLSENSRSPVYQWRDRGAMVEPQEPVPHFT